MSVIGPDTANIIVVPQNDISKGRKQTDAGNRFVDFHNPSKASVRKNLFRPNQRYYKGLLVRLEVKLFHFPSQDFLIFAILKGQI